jgi:hypothetical protein
MEIVKLKEIKNLLPKNSWVGERLNNNTKDFENELVIFVKGDLVTENINLDNILESLPEIKGAKVDENLIFLLLIDGDLTANNIYNEEDDGSGGLIILGNATVNNMIVGGQEIFITGNLTIAECFWGNYNHGMLKVTGAINAQIFMATDEYAYDFEKENLKANYFLCDDMEERDEEEYSQMKAYSIFVDEIHWDETDDDDPTGWSDWLSRNTAIRLLTENKNILKTDIRIITQEELDASIYAEIPLIFERNNFTTEIEFQVEKDNYEKLFSLVKSDEDYYEYHLEDLGVTIFVIKEHLQQAENGKQEQKIHFVIDDILQIYLYCKHEEALSSNNISMIAVYTDDNNELDKEYNLFANEKLLTSFKKIWNELLLRFERGIFFKQRFEETVQVNEVLHLLSLPIVKDKYNDYENEDKNGFWSGNYFIGMRLHGANNQVGSLDIGMEIEDIEEFDVWKLLLHPNSLENPTFIELLYNSSQNGTTTDKYNDFENKVVVDMLDWELYEKAIKLYPKLTTAIENNNKSFIHKYIEDENEVLEKKESVIKKMDATLVMHKDKTIIYGGVTFKIINWYEANKLLAGLKDLKGEQIYNVYEDNWRFPDDEENAVFLLAEEDVHIKEFTIEYSEETAIDDYFVLAFIFMKNIKVDTYIISNDIDNSPALIVMGNVEVKNISLAGNIYFIGGDLVCDSLLGEYNHGELYVKGNTTAQLIYTYDMRMYFNKFVSLESIVCEDIFRIHLNLLFENENGDIVIEQGYFPSTHYIQEIVKDIFLEKDGNDYKLCNNIFNKAIALNESLIDVEKLSTYNKKNHFKTFETFFTFLLEFKEYKKDKLLMTFYGRGEKEAMFLPFESENKAHHLLSYNYLEGSNLKVQLLRKEETKELNLYFDLIDDEGDSRVSWTCNEEIVSLERNCAIHAIYEGYNAIVTKCVP